MQIQRLNLNFRLTTPFILKLWFALGYSRKNSNLGVGLEDIEFPRCIKERAYWNSRGQLKKKWNFQQWSRKNHAEFPSVLLFRLGISKSCLTTVWDIQRCSFTFSRISKGEVASPKITAFFLELEIFCFAKMKSILNVFKH